MQRLSKCLRAPFSAVKRGFKHLIAKFKPVKPMADPKASITAIRWLGNSYTTITEYIRSQSFEEILTLMEKKGLSTVKGLACPSVVAMEISGVGGKDAQVNADWPLSELDVFHSEPPDHTHLFISSTAALTTKEYSTIEDAVPYVDLSITLTGPQGPQPTQGDDESFGLTQLFSEIENEAFCMDLLFKEREDDVALCLNLFFREPKDDALCLNLLFAELKDDALLLQLLFREEVDDALLLQLLFAEEADEPLCLNLLFKEEEEEDSLCLQLLFYEEMDDGLFLDLLFHEPEDAALCLNLLFCEETGDNLCLNLLFDDRVTIKHRARAFERPSLMRYGPLHCSVEHLASQSLVTWMASVKV